MGLSPKFGKYTKFPTEIRKIRTVNPSEKISPSVSGKSVVVLSDNSLYPPLEGLSLLLSSHQRRF